MLRYVQSVYGAKVTSARWLAAAWIALLCLGVFADITRAELPSATPGPPPVETESAATTPTTTVARAPSPSDELNTLLMHATFLPIREGTKPLYVRHPVADVAAMTETNSSFKVASPN